MTEPLEQDEILTYPEAAAVLRISVRSLYRAVGRGEVPYFRIGNAVRFSRKALLALAVPQSEAG